MESPPYDSGIAWRISVEMPLALDVDALRAPLAQLGLAVLERRAPQAVEREARRALASDWGVEHVGWCRDTLQLMQEEYAARIGYLADAIRELERNGNRSAIATHAVCRLAERLVLESQLRADAHEPLERDLASGDIDARDAVEHVAIGAGRRLDIPSDELTRAMHRAAAGALRAFTAPDSRSGVLLAAGALATDDRRARVVAWAESIAEEFTGCHPLLAAALGEAADMSQSLTARDDPLWRGAVRGAILQHEAWRLDGPHTNEPHPLLVPL